ncbi:MAG TPA: metallophosphoesterase family protein [Burkholderiales bacterium]|nr:metallophosphoesterase family protein [Burkholderiales bacterium]
MRTIVHLSDLHFGRVDPALLSPLSAKVEALAPHLVVISGDLTQRAKPDEFRKARAFLEALPKPQVVVPGNHDVPLYNVFQRFFQPLTKYRRFISEELEPVYIDAEIAVVGVNTARSNVFKGGRINGQQIERVRGLICELPVQVTKIVVTHHPFDLPPGHASRQLVGRARRAMAMLARCGADILLSGHLHESHAGDTRLRYKIDDFAALVVQAGTATSTRGRGESNSFNVLRVEHPRVHIERLTWNGADFAPADAVTYLHTADGWTRS